MPRSLTTGPYGATIAVNSINRRPARLGAIVAAAICGVIAIGGWIVGLPALVLTVPAALAWAILVRFLAGRGLAC